MQWIKTSDSLPDVEVGNGFQVDILFSSTAYGPILVGKFDTSEHRTTWLYYNYEYDEYYFYDGTPAYWCYLKLPCDEAI